jgi:hypothetical protein
MKKMKNSGEIKEEEDEKEERGGGKDRKWEEKD